MDKRQQEELRMIEAVLESQELSDEQRETLEETRKSYTSPLLPALREAIKRGEQEVAIALAKAFLDECRIPGPHQADCVIYCRVSTERQTKGSGLARQLDTCMEYAKRKGYSVVAVFSEVWTGADELHVRSQAERMAKARGCKIVCEDYDRWSRRGIEDLPPKNVEMASEAVREFEEEMKKLFTATQLYVMNSRLM